MGKSKNQTFKSIEHKVWKRLRVWKGKLLSSVGREILVKAVAQAIPSSMSCFLLPRYLCHRLGMLAYKFWWGSSEEKRKIHWINWDSLSTPKCFGGLGFKDLRCFNLALLAKQGWKLLSNPTTLISRVLKAKYFNNCDFLDANLGSNPSYTW